MQNVSPSMRYNFNKIPNSKWRSYGQAYDVNSVMQYPGYAFSQNGQPVLINRSTRKPIGWNTKLTASDFAQINSLYGCRSKPTAKPTTRTTARPTRRTTTTRKTTRATTRPSTCSDYTGYSAQCKGWKAIGYCQTYNRASMEFYCSRTCGFCSTGGRGKVQRTEEKSFNGLSATIKINTAMTGQRLASVRRIPLICTSPVENHADYADQHK